MRPAGSLLSRDRSGRKRKRRAGPGEETVLYQTFVWDVNTRIAIRPTIARRCGLANARSPAIGRQLVRRVPDGIWSIASRIRPRAPRVFIDDRRICVVSCVLPRPQGALSTRPRRYEVF